MDICDYLTGRHRSTFSFNSWHVFVAFYYYPAAALRWINFLSNDDSTQHKNCFINWCIFKYRWLYIVCFVLFRNEHLYFCNVLCFSNLFLSFALSWCNMQYAPDMLIQRLYLTWLDADINFVFWRLGHFSLITVFRLYSAQCRGNYSAI